MYAIEKKTLSQLLKKILIWEFRNGVKLFWFYFSQVDIFVWMYWLGSMHDKHRIDKMGIIWITIPAPEVNSNITICCNMSISTISFNRGVINSTWDVTTSIYITKSNLSNSPANSYCIKNWLAWMNWLRWFNIPICYFIYIYKSSIFKIWFHN